MEYALEPLANAAVTSVSTTSANAAVTAPAAECCNTTSIAYSALAHLHPVPPTVEKAGAATERPTEGAVCEWVGNRDGDGDGDRWKRKIEVVRRSGFHFFSCFCKHGTMADIRPGKCFLCSD